MARTINLQQMQKETLELAKVSDKELIRGAKVYSNDKPESLYQLLQAEAEKIKREEDRLPNSIHGSSFWKKCPRQFISEVTGATTSNVGFNYSNFLAADAGDQVHSNFQDFVSRIGLPIRLPGNYEKVTEGNVLNFPAVELDLWTYYSLSPDLFNDYEKAGFNRAALKQFPEFRRQLVEEYRLGIRIDLILQRQGKEPFICEIKSVKDDHFKKIAKLTQADIEEIVSIPDGEKSPAYADKIKGYIRQLQMQMHWWLNPYTNTKSEWGMLAVVNRNDESQMRELYIPFNPAVAEAYLPLIKFKKEIWDCIDQNKGFGLNVDQYMEMLGLKEVPGDDCSWCDFWKLCNHPDKKKHVGMMIEVGKRANANKAEAKLHQQSFEALLSEN